MNIAVGMKRRFFAPPLVMFGLYYTVAKKERPSFLQFAAAFPFAALAFRCSCFLDVKAFRAPEAASRSGAWCEAGEWQPQVPDAPADKLLLAAAYYHIKSENIHPFADGNGRTGRLTMNYFLVLNGHPPVTIHQEDRKDYYAALEAWDERQELEPMEAFLRQQAVKTWEKQLGRR